MQMLQQFEIRHTRREGNKAAQFINDFVTWVEETPLNINFEISSDVN